MQSDLLDQDTALMRLRQDALGQIKSVQEHSQKFRQAADKKFGELATELRKASEALKECKKHIDEQKD
jgi:hypothetical protein